MPVLVDSNVLLDVLTEDARWAPWSMAALAAQAERDLLAINPIIYAEVSVGFARIEDLDAALPPPTFHRLALPWEAAFLAARCFVAYRRRGGRRSSPLSGLLHRRARQRVRDDAAHARPRALPHVLPQARADCSMTHPRHPRSARA